MTEGIINIRKGREKPIRNKHPWIFSGAISNAVDADDGDVVKVVDHKGNFLARGYWNHLSQIQVRIMTWQEDEEINEAWWRKMIQRAITNRYPKPEFYAGNRVINAENDFMPGLVVDRYSSFLVLQALTLHIDQQKQMIAELLAELFEQADMPIKGIYERSDVDVRGKEGLKASTGLLWGEEPPELIPFRDDNLIRMVDVRTGHKTGYYLDQRENHALIQALSAENSWTLDDNRILNTFSFSGGFGLRSTAHVVNVDSSEEALELAKHSYKSNEWREKNVDFIQADVFDYLRDAIEEGEEYDLVILDPPKFAQNKRQVDGAARGYKDINLNGFKLVKSGGYLMTFSCSGAISRDLFQKIVFGALADSGRQGQIIKHLSASSDHPVALTFPEGEYLKGLLVKVY